MLENLIGLKWIGDLSLEDADVLVQYGKLSKNILEFGCGGSTQILAQCGAQNIISVDTNPDWIAVTAQRLTQLTIHTPVEFLNYTTEFDQPFDLIFVDGVWEHRENFATSVWRNLKIGGVMIFHDTRRDFDFANAADVAKKFYNEISHMDINAHAANGRSSNMTILHKKAIAPYENWNDLESKPQWSYGTLDNSHPLWEYTDQMLGHQDEYKIYSQNGEDGIIDKIFKYVGTTNKIAVEFGVSAGGGGTETNTRYLANQGWKTHWFDIESATNLPSNCEFKQVFLTKNNIVSEFEAQEIPKEFDLLSIDVDGNDYYLREALAKYSPRVCVMEYNGTVPADQEYIMPYDEQYQWQLWQKDFGASLLSLTKQADKLGYDLVYCDSQGVNAFFIRRDLNPFPVRTVSEAYKQLWWAR